MAGGEQPDHGFHVACVRGLDAFLSLESDWRALSERVRPANPFLTWEWVSEWVRSFWDDGSLTVSVYSGERAVAIAPFCAGWSLPVPGMGAKHLQLLGPRWGQNLLEMGAVLLDPTQASDALSLIIDAVWRETDVDWIEVVATGAEIGAWQRAVDSARVRTRTITEARSEIPVMALDDGWEQLRSRLRRNVKQSIRHAYNSARHDGVVYRYREHRTVAGLDEVLDEFFRLHRERANAPIATPHADHFGHPPAQLFLRRVARKLAEAGMLNISVCEVDGACVAVRINLEVDGTLYLYYSGFDPRWARYSVMTFATTEAIKSAIDRHFLQVNFSPGVDQAKKRWDVDMVPLSRFSLVHNGVRSRARFALYQTLRRASGWRKARSLPVPRSRPGARSPQAARRSVLILGDSLVEGGGATSLGWAQIVRRNFRESVVSGIGGDTSRDLLRRTARLTLRRHDLVLVGIGLNDSRYRPSRGATEVPWQEYESNLAELCRLFGRADGEIAFVGLTRVDEDLTVPYRADLCFRNADIAHFDEALKRAAGSNGAHYIASPDLRASPGLLCDGLHPSQAGHDLIAAAVRSFLSL